MIQSGWLIFFEEKHVMYGSEYMTSIGFEKYY